MLSLVALPLTVVLAEGQVIELMSLNSLITKR
jgi:hypothetical protein